MKIRKYFLLILSLIFIKQCKNTCDFSRETCTREYELYENFSKHIGKLVCRHGAKPCNKETELLGTLKTSITTTQQSYS